MKFAAWIAPCLLAGSFALAQEPTPADPLQPPAETDVAIFAPVGGGLEVTELPTNEVVAVVPHATAAPGQVCCPIAVVDTRRTHAAKRAYRCGGPATETVVCVKNPADCRLYSVPFCVPGCCLGTPQVCNLHVGLLGRGYADVVWPNGFSATVAFRVHGGAIVVYKG